MKNFRIYFFVLLFILVSSNIYITNAHHWQYSNNLSLEIGLRDKYGNFQNTIYTANFVVYAPDGKTYYYTAKGSSDNWVRSKVPNDYKGLLLTPGDYSWQCYVDGEVVTSGGFRVSREGFKETISVL